MGVKRLPVRLALTIPVMVVLSLVGEWIYDRAKFGVQVPDLEQD